jgi:AcrR family transcriptional regulator
MTRAERKARTRADLLAAAARVFAREGFNGASIETIAEEAGYSHGAVYSNFAGKEELFIALAEEYSAVRVAETSLPFESDAEFRDQIRDAADIWMQRLRDDPQTFILRLEFALHATRSPPLAEAFAARSADVRLLVEQVLARHARRSKVRYPLPERDLALAMRALGVGLAVERMLEPRAVPDELFGDFAVMLLDLIEGRPPARRRRRRPAGGAKSRAARPR